MKQQAMIDSSKLDLHLLFNQRLDLADLIANGDLIAVSESQREALGRLDDDILAPIANMAAAVLLLDFEQTRADKLALLETLNGANLSEHQTTVLDGLLGLLDDVQDQAAKQYGEFTVFGRLDKDDPEGDGATLLRNLISEQEIGPMEALNGLALFLDDESENAAVNHQNLPRAEMYRIMAVQLRDMAEKAHH